MDSMNQNATRLPCYSGIAVPFECGGPYAGFCDHATGSCVCINRWSGKSEFTFVMDLRPYGGRVLDCPVHLPALRGLYAVCLITSVGITLFTLGKVLPHAVMTFKRYAEKRPEKECWSYLPLKIVAVVLVTLLSADVFYTIKVIAPESLLGVDEPVTSVWLITATGLQAAAYLDITARRNSVLKKDSFLRGQGSTETSRRLKAARRSFKVLAIVTYIPYVLMYVLLPRFPPSADDEALPFANGRFLLWPGGEILLVLMLIIYQWVLKKDMQLINGLFQKLRDMTKMSSKKDYTKSFTRRTLTAMEEIDIARRNLESFYQKSRRAILFRAFSVLVFICIPFMWSKRAWLVPLTLPGFLGPSFKLLSNHVPSAFGKVRVDLSKPHKRKSGWFRTSLSRGKGESNESTDVTRDEL